ncbi:hypothetical protein ABMA70_15675, partial [Halobacteriovorax sp. XZX-3]|uniref:hypothetical protein n=1 Tax=Halobacteriovorax sp. XZX-3 TaxID=3157722 RepID=UPI00371246C5
LATIHSLVLPNRYPCSDRAVHHRDSAPILPSSAGTPDYSTGYCDVPQGGHYGEHRYAGGIVP